MAIPLLLLTPHLIDQKPISIPVCLAFFVIIEGTEVILKKIKHPLLLIFCDLLWNKDTWQNLQV